MFLGSALMCFKKACFCLEPQQGEGCIKKHGRGKEEEAPCYGSGTVPGKPSEEPLFDIQESMMGRELETSAQVGEERDRRPPLSSRSSSFSSAFLSGFLARKNALDPLQSE